MPLVSVVLIAYNDAANLPTALRSAQRQTLRDLEIVVVDDASTDATPDVVAAAAASDDRIRPVRLERNSGGCSRPRNAGVEVAIGDYVMFLDSDDELAPHAAARLVAAARRSGADVVCGRTVRRHHHPRRYLGWHDRLYTRDRTVEGLAEFPDLLYDTAAWNKLYRRRFLDEHAIRFVEGMVYEDLPFTAEALLAAKRIAVVRDLVYVYHVRRRAEVPSITVRRELRNWTDRFEGQRRIDAALDRHAASDVVRRTRLRKFFDIDMTMFMRQLREFPPESRPELVQVAGAYTKTLDLNSTEGARPARLGARLAAAGDVAGVLAAADWSATGGVRGVLDVSAAELGAVGFATTPFLAVATEATADDATVTIEATVHDLFGRLHDVGAVDLVIRGRAGGVLWRRSARATPSADGLRVTATVDLAALGRRLFAPTVGHELRLALVLRKGGEQVERPLSARDASLPAGELALPSPWRGLVGDRVRLGEVNGRLVLTLSALPGGVDAALETATVVRNAVRRARLRARQLRS